MTSNRGRSKGALGDQGLTLAFTVLLLGSLVAQLFTGLAGYNEQARDARLPPSRRCSTSRRPSSPSTSRRTGSRSTCSSCSTSCSPCGWSRWDRRSPSDRRARHGVRPGPEGRTRTRTRTRHAGRRRRMAPDAVLPLLGATMGAIFLLSWSAQFVAGRSAYNAEQIQDLQEPLDAGSSTRSRPTSGTARSRTGSRSSSPSPRWWSSASTCASAGHPSPSPWAARTTPPASRAEQSVSGEAAHRVARSARRGRSGATPRR